MRVLGTLIADMAKSEAPNKLNSMVSWLESELLTKHQTQRVGFLVRAIKDVFLEGCGDIIPKGTVGVVRRGFDLDMNMESDKSSSNRVIFFEKGKVKSPVRQAAPIYNIELLEEFPDSFEEVPIG